MLENIFNRGENSISIRMKNIRVPQKYIQQLLGRRIPKNNKKN